MLETVGTKRFADVSNDITSLAAAFIGTEGAIEFAEFCRNYNRQVTPEDIIIEGDMSKVAHYGLNEHVSLIMKMENSDLIKEEFDDKRTANIAQYFVSLPSEAAMKLWGVIGKNRTNTIKLHKCNVDGKPVKDFIVSLLAQKTE
jgi:hypothetical protein